MSQELFQQAFERYGRVWRLPDKDSLEARAIQELLELCRWAVQSQRRNTGPNGSVYCDLIENPTFNALATTHGGREFVTLFSGAANHIYQAFFCLLSDPESLSSLGDPSREEVSRHALEILRAGGGVLAPEDIPKDRQRVSAARDFALFTCFFILLHEVGHIVRCHPTFLQRKYGLSAYEELPLSRPDGRLARIRVAFEWEADEYAAITSYQLVRTALQSQVFAVRPISELPGDHVWAISASMTFALTGQMAGGDMLQESPTHPSAFHRYLWSMLSVEGASECKAFTPQTPVLQQGFNDVVGWLLRNRIAVQIGGTGRPLHESILLRQFADKHSFVRKALSEEQPLLDNLVDERNAAARAWLHTHG